MSFDEQSLRADIVATWGAYGAHIDVYDMLLARLADLETRLADLTEQVQR